jgi:hypothetical protein
MEQFLINSLSLSLSLPLSTPPAPFTKLSVSGNGGKRRHREPKRREEGIFHLKSAKGASRFVKCSQSIPKNSLSCRERARARARERERERETQ